MARRLDRGRGSQTRDPAAPSPAQGRIALGVLVRPHGVRGELHVHLFHEESNALLEQSAVYLGAQATQPTAVIAWRRTPKGALVHLEGVDRRETADTLRGVELQVDRDALPALDDEEVYLADLVGLGVYDRHGQQIGEVTGVVNYPSIDCLRVRVAEGVREVPTVEPWLAEIDLERGRVIVEAIEELALERD